VAAYLHAQRGFLQTQDRAGFDESCGIAQGYGLVHDDLLVYLHANIVADLDASLDPPGPPETDGCTAWAYAAGAAALVVKNRDYRGEHGALQQVFLHRDPAWQTRSLLCVGSLGSPGAFSSGMNSDGLAVADTQIGTRDHGVGWLRYFLMTALLRECRDVAQALAFIRAVPHAGGGALVLGDRHGQVAAVALGHHTPPHVTQSTQWVAQTNHCTDGALARHEQLPQGDPTDCTFTRLQQVQAALSQAGARMELAQARSLMSSHRAHGGICRHAQGESARTLSCAVYDTRDASLHMSHGNPCDAPWKSYTLAAAGKAQGMAP
jgi:predicted choloylglycine hydrolase